MTHRDLCSTDYNFSLIFTNEMLHHSGLYRHRIDNMITAILFVTFLIHPIHSCQNGLLRDISTSSTSGSSSIPLATREYWMRAANNALSEQGNPCPFYPFGAVVVNHTLNGLGKLVCSGVNKVRVDGNPTLHGEIVAINNCTKILSENMGLSPEGVLSAFSQLTIYTNGEACPMVSVFCLIDFRFSIRS